MYRRLKSTQKNHLWQGDIIDRQELTNSGALAGHQDYISTRRDLPAFCVITQTCDLMPNRRADYVTLAVVRYLRNIFSPEDLANSKRRDSTRSLVEKIVNHRENKGFFYLHPHPRLIME